MEVKVGGVRLRGVIYIDSVFLLNLVMDLYLLCLTGKALGKKVSLLKVFWGSVAGAAGYCLILCVPGISYPHKVLFGMIPVGGLMVKTACKTRGPGELFRAMGVLFTFSFLMGGFIIFVKGKSAFAARGDSVAIILGLGFGGYVLGRKLTELWRKKRNNHFCRVTLPGDEGPLELAALIDTGNGLVEPVSGNPVAILDAERWESLKTWMKPEKYKAIPYHSIGREKGVMEGYEIGGVSVKGDDGEERYDKMIVAVFKGNVAGDGSYQMILPPELAI